MRKQAKVVSIQICRGHRKSMEFKQEVEALQGIGLNGDIHAVPESGRQVLLIDKETLDVLQLQPGIVKENLTTEGIDLMALKFNQRLQVGEAVLEITKECKPCERMNEIRHGLQTALEGRRGMLARVVKSGVIRSGDLILIL